MKVLLVWVAILLFTVVGYRPNHFELAMVDSPRFTVGKQHIGLIVVLLKRFGLFFTPKRNKRV